MVPYDYVTYNTIYFLILENFSLYVGLDKVSIMYLPILSFELLIQHNYVISRLYT